MRRTDKVAAIIGSTLGIAISGYALVYVPMKRNHDECGTVTLCKADKRSKKEAP